MASGYGLSGGMRSAHIFILDDSLLTSLPGPSRCFPFWQEVLACYVVNTNEEDDSGKAKCQAPREDYYECLHHRKEVRQRDLAYRRSLSARSITDPFDTSSSQANTIGTYRLREQGPSRQRTARQWLLMLGKTHRLLARYGV